MSYSKKTFSAHISAARAYSWINSHTLFSHSRVVSLNRISEVRTHKSKFVPYNYKQRARRLLTLLLLIHISTKQGVASNSIYVHYFCLSFEIYLLRTRHTGTRHKQSKFRVKINYHLKRKSDTELFYLSSSCQRVKFVAFLQT